MIAIKRIKTGFGRPRHAFVCDCGRPVIKLYHHHGQLSCRRCTGARYASQALDKKVRPVLQAMRIESFLNAKPKLHNSTKEHLRKRFGEKVLMAQGKLGTQVHSGLWD